jgi:serine/threonine-protein kinase
MQTQTERPSVRRQTPSASLSDGPADKLILDRYRLDRRLAVGGTAEVWSAHDELLDRQVAVKLLHAHLVTDHRSRERLAIEAEAVGALAHPGVARIYDLDLDAGRPALVLELIDGPSLGRRLDDGPLPPRRAAAIVAEVASALAHAHARGVVHRDVKPGNILLDGNQHAHLVDFGIAQAIGASEQHLTWTGTIAGTLPYMAPEQLSDGAIGPWTDLYALGIVLHEALTGRLPHGSGAPVALARRQSAGPPPMPGMAPALAAVIRACLAASPKARPGSAALVAAALRGWLAGDSSRAFALSPSEQHRMHRGVFELAGLRQWNRRPDHRRPIVAAVAASAAAGLLAFAIASGGTRAPDAVAAPAEGVQAGTPVGEATPGSGPDQRQIMVGDPTGELIPVAPANESDGSGGGTGLQPPADSSGSPPWMSSMVADYRRGCGASAEDLDLSGLSRSEAGTLVSSRIDACSDAAEGRQPAHGRGHGRGHDRARHERGDHGHDQRSDDDHHSRARNHSAHGSDHGTRHVRGRGDGRSSPGLGSVGAYSV